MLERDEMITRTEQRTIRIGLDFDIDRCHELRISSPNMRAR
jgi:hypothetical protein